MPVVWTSDGQRSSLAIRVACRKHLVHKDFSQQQET